MKEAISNSLIFTLVITFLFIFVILFAGSTAYTKAFKVKNRIISIIEKNDGYNGTAVNEINLALKDAGYKISLNNADKCQSEINNRFKNTNQAYKHISTGNSSYRYCIAEFTVSTPAIQGKYYAVIAYMYFEVPLIGAHLEFPVYGETKTLGTSY